MDQSVEGAGRPRRALQPALEVGHPTGPAAGEHMFGEPRQCGAGGGFGVGHQGGGIL